MDYGNILTRAWKITWNHKVLWIFGVLAALGSGGGGGGGGNANLGSRGGTGPGGFPGGDFPGFRQFERFLERTDVITVMIIGVVALLVCLGLALAILSVIGRGGLIGGARLADETGQVTFGEAWGIGLKSFWRLFLIGLLVALPVLVVVVAAVVAALATGLFTRDFGPSLIAGLACFAPLICLVALAAIPLSIWAHFARFAAVLDDQGVRDSLRKAWQVIKANVGPIIVLGLILIVASWILGFVLAIPVIIVVIPAVLAFVLGGDQPNVALLATAGIAFLCYLPIALVLQGVFETWQTSAWTLAWRKFTGAAATPAPVSPAPPLEMPETMQAA